MLSQALSSADPIALTALVGVILALAAFVVAWFARRSALKGAIIALAVVFLLPTGYLLVISNPWLVDARFRTFRSFYRDIQVGMTREQVLATLERRYPPMGRGSDQRLRVTRRTF